VYTPPVSKIRDIRYCRKLIFKGQNVPKSFVAGRLPDPLGELTPDSLAAFDGPTAKRGEEREGICYAPHVEHS